jgi:putative spermidine/putrescine transport system permease protein
VKQSWIPAAVLGLVYVLLLGPFLVIIVVSFGADSNMSFPPTGFSMEWYGKVFSVRMFRDAFWTSLNLALSSTATALALGVPVAYALVRFRFPGHGPVEVVLSSPAIVPGMVVGFALLRYFVLLGNTPVFLGLYLGHTAILLPYTVRVVSSSLRNFAADVEEAAVSLGSTRLRAFFSVVLPNIRAGVAAAFILAFIMSFNDVPVSLFLTGPGVTALPVQMLLYMEYTYDPTIAALSSVLIVFTMLVVQAAERVLGISQYV